VKSEVKKITHPGTATDTLQDLPVLELERGTLIKGESSQLVVTRSPGHFSLFCTTRMFLS